MHRGCQGGWGDSRLRVASLHNKQDCGGLYARIALVDHPEHTNDGTPEHSYTESRQVWMKISALLGDSAAGIVAWPWP